MLDKRLCIIYRCDKSIRVLTDQLLLVPLPHSSHWAASGQHFWLLPLNFSGLFTSPSPPLSLLGSFSMNCHLSHLSSALPFQQSDVVWGLILPKDFSTGKSSVKSVFGLLFSVFTLWTWTLFVALCCSPVLSGFISYEDRLFLF
jgi:hypothetical protein